MFHDHKYNFMFLVTAESFPRVLGNKFGPLPSSSCLTRVSHNKVSKANPSWFLHTVSDQKMDSDNAKHDKGISVYHEACFPGICTKFKLMVELAIGLFSCQAIKYLNVAEAHSIKVNMIADIVKQSRTFSW